MTNCLYQACPRVKPLIMFRVEIGTLDISLKGHVLCSLMLPFYMHPAVGGVYCHNLGVCQLRDAASFVLTPLNIRTQGVTSNKDRRSGAKPQGGGGAGVTEAVC